MLIEREEIEKAKEKLGDRNATIIADLLELDDFDEKNLKACCPYHEEDTPSFIYDKKRHRFHCFGCDKNVDIIDVLMEKGYTFLDAAKYLFEEAGIAYSFGEQNVKTRQKYRYPHEEPLGDRTKTIKYWGKRGISKATLDYLDVREDSNGNTVFNYYDTNDVLTMVKYRPARTITKEERTPKIWCQKDADTTPLLFNMNRVNPTKSLLIAEGEGDLASVIESGYLNAVSVPLGAQNLHWIEENWDWLDQFPEIIIWADNDEAGEKMRKDCIYRLGTWRTKYVTTPQYYEVDGRQIPIKDINECLQMGGKQFVLDLISNAQDVPVTSVVDYADITQIDVSDMDGIKTGIKALDQELIKIFDGTLTLLSGRPGSGKTSFIDQVVAECIDNGNSVFMFSRELPAAMSTNWMNFILAGRRNISQMTKDGDSFYVVPYSKQAEIQEYYRGKLLIYKDDEPNDVESILKSAEECVRKYGVKFVVLDNLMMIDLKCSENERNQAQTDFINELIHFAVKFNVAVVLCLHPHKLPDSNSDIGIYDLSGSSNIINLAMRSIGLRRVTRQEKEDPRNKWSKYDVVLSIIKDRMLGKSDFQMGLWYDNVSRRFYTNYDEYDKQYSWDVHKYTDEIEYIDRLHPSIDDFFPDQ